MQKSTGKTPDQLKDQPPLPEELEHLWLWWMEMRAGEGLTNSEMLAWCQLRQVKLAQWEIDVIRSLDRIFWSVTQ